MPNLLVESGVCFTVALKDLYKLETRVLLESWKAVSIPFYKI